MGLFPKFNYLAVSIFINLLETIIKKRYTDERMRDLGLSQCHSFCLAQIPRSSICYCFCLLDTKLGQKRRSCRHRQKTQPIY